MRFLLPRQIQAVASVRQAAVRSELRSLMGAPLPSNSKRH